MDLAPNSVSRHGSHAHHSGVPVWCSVGSMGNTLRHRPHSRSAGPGAACLAFDSLADMAAPRRRGRGVEHGAAVLDRPAQTRRLFQLDALYGRPVATVAGTFSFTASRVTSYFHFLVGTSR